MTQEAGARCGPIVVAIGLQRSGCVLRPMSPADEPFARDLFKADRGLLFADIPEPMRTALLDQQFRAQQIGYRQTFPDAAHLCS